MCSRTEVIKSYIGTAATGRAFARDATIGKQDGLTADRHIGIKHTANRTKYRQKNERFNWRINTEQGRSKSLFSICAETAAPSRVNFRKIKRGGLNFRARIFTGNPVPSGLRKGVQNVTEVNENDQS